MADDQVAEEFQLALSGVGVEVKRVISPQKAALIMSVIMGLEPAKSEASSGVLEQPGTAGVIRVSLREFLDSVEASKKPDQIVAIGQYMNVHEGRPTFTRDQIKSHFQTAREPMPANFPRDFGVAMKNGMIAEDHKQAGHYYVTKTGVHAVESHFRPVSKK